MKLNYFQIILEIFLKQLEIFPCDGEQREERGGGGGGERAGERLSRGGRTDGPTPTPTPVSFFHSLQLPSITHPSYSVTPDIISFN